MTAPSGVNNHSRYKAIPMTARRAGRGETTRKALMDAALRQIARGRSCDALSLRKLTQ